jgi:hypothetical protein
MKKTSDPSQSHSKRAIDNSLGNYQSQTEVFIIKQPCTSKVNKITTNKKMYNTSLRYNCWGRSIAIWRPLLGCSSFSS